MDKEQKRDIGLVIYYALLPFGAGPIAAIWADYVTRNENAFEGASGYSAVVWSFLLWIVLVVGGHIVGAGLRKSPETLPWVVMLNIVLGVFTIRLIFFIYELLS